MENSVPAARGVAVETLIADRTVAGRREQYATEVRRLIDAAFVVMRRSGSIDPQVRRESASTPGSGWGMSG